MAWTSGIVQLFAEQSHAAHSKSHNALHQDETDKPEEKENDEMRPRPGNREFRGKQDCETGSGAANGESPAKPDRLERFQSREATRCGLDRLFKLGWHGKFCQTDSSFSAFRLWQAPHKS